MAESWSDDTRELRKKAKIIYECGFLPEFFTEFPDKDNLSDKEMGKYSKKMLSVLRAKIKSLELPIKEINELLVFFTLNWRSLKSTNNPKLRIYSICHLCMDYFNRAAKDRKLSVIKKYNIFFNAFFTKKRLINLTKVYSDKELSNILKNNYELN
jgi:hypothetical protein